MNSNHVLTFYIPHPPPQVYLNKSDKSFCKKRKYIPQSDQEYIKKCICGDFCSDRQISEVLKIKCIG
jgi:hypothetical protein